MRPPSENPIGRRTEKVEERTIKICDASEKARPEQSLKNSTLGHPV
jgi:hypothetical protein